MNNKNEIVYKQPQNLAMTDYFFLFGMWLVVFWAVDPFNWQFDLRAVIKHFPMVVISPAFVLSAAGGVLFNSRNTLVDEPDNNRGLVIIIVVFSLLVIIGSLYARFVRGIDNSFLTMGMYTMTAPLTIWFIKRSSSPVSLVKGVLFIYLFWSLIAIGMQAIHINQEVFHQREHLVIGILVMVYFLAIMKWVRFIALGFLVFASFIAHKNTAYMVMLLIMSYVFMVWALQHGQKIKDGFLRWSFWIRIILTAVFFAATVVIIYYYVKSTLPTGNPEYRLHTYEIAWNKFLSSPIWGTGFTEAATEKFDLFTVAVSTTQVLPTHSDPLDILAQGGLIGFSLWVAIFILLSRQWTSIVLYPERQQNPKVLPYLHTLYCLMYSGIVVCMFNPILNSPNLAWTFWGVIGMLIALLPPPLRSVKEVS